MVCGHGAKGRLDDVGGHGRSDLLGRLGDGLGRVVVDQLGAQHEAKHTQDLGHMSAQNRPVPGMCCAEMVWCVCCFGGGVSLAKGNHLVEKKRTEKKRFE